MDLYIDYYLHFEFPTGDNVIAGSYEARLSWFDMDLSTKPYKTMKYHKSAIRSVAFHRKYPLFASASDDGTVIVSHGMVYKCVLIFKGCMSDYMNES